jgi:hypothetical protein
VSGSSWTCSTRVAGECICEAVELVVWSGTGHSRRVAERVAAAAQDRGAHAVSCLPYAPEAIR